MACRSSGPCGAVPVTHWASLLSISPVYHRSNQRLATRDPSDVSPLSWQGIGPLSTPLQDGLRFFRPPLPTRPQANPYGPLSTLPVGTVGLTTFHTRTIPEGVRPRLTAGSAGSARGKRTLPRPDCSPFWFMPVSLFGMFPITTARQRFTSVGHILQPQLPTALRLAVATSPHGSVARLSGGGYSVPSASHLEVTPNARLGRVPVAEHRILISLINTRATSCRTSPAGVERGRMAEVAKGAAGSRSRRRPYASASDTPSSHLWELWA